MEKFWPPSNWTSKTFKVVDRAYRNTPSTPEQKKKNQRNSGTWSTVEHVFGILKLHYGMGQIAEAEALAKKSIDSGYKIRTVSNWKRKWSVYPLRTLGLKR